VLEMIALTYVGQSVHSSKKDDDDDEAIRDVWLVHVAKNKSRLLDVN